MTELVDTRRFAPVAAGNLVAGDVIDIGEDGVARVTRAPETVHRGHSLFDELQIFVGICVQPLASSAPASYLVLPPGAPVPALRV
jgi:hypothetical protein